MQANEQLAAKLARLEHLLSRNSQNSSLPPSRDDDLGRTSPAEKPPQHAIPQISVSITRYDQHRVRCGCGRIHTAARPEGARTGPVGYGRNLQALGK